MLSVCLSVVRRMMQDMNIYELIRGRRHYVADERVRGYMYQLMKALDHMHRNGIFHRLVTTAAVLPEGMCTTQPRS
jgi:serine/threonine protein kinase